MITRPLVSKKGHLFVNLDGNLWLFDTGAPTSFGAHTNIVIADQKFELTTEYFGLTHTRLSDYVGVPCVGLLGVDVLNQFDHILDTARNTLTLSATELPHNGRIVPLSDFMGIPILTVSIAHTHYPMFFDTGAQVSYFQDESVRHFPPAGPINDFYPGFGSFQTETYQVDVELAHTVFSIRCGILPDMLGATLMMANTQGIIGNAILINRSIGFFPRRNILSIIV